MGESFVDSANRLALLYFIRPVLLAFVISIPIAWTILNKWLEGFAYKADIDWTATVFQQVLERLMPVQLVGSRS